MFEGDVETFYNFFKHESPTEIRVFDSEKYPNGKSVFVSDKNSFVSKVKEFQDEKVDVYIGFRDRKAKGDANVNYSDCIFFEIDEHDIEKPLEKAKVEELMKKNNIEFGMVGFSGGGYHFYIPHKKKYFFNEEDRVSYKKVLDAFKKALLDNKIDVDPAVFNLERVSRVLGSQNFKRNAQSKILYHNSELDKDKNHLAIKQFILKYDQKEKIIDTTAIQLLEKYKIDKTDRWLYDLIKQGVIIKSDTGGNSIVFKTAAIILTREGIPKEEIKIIGKALSDLTEGRTLSAFMGWVKQALNGMISEVNEFEMDKFMSEGNYPLTKYSEVKEVVQKEEIKNTQSNTYELKTYEDFKNLKKNRNYIVDGFLYPGSVNMIYSPPAQFKSLISCNMGLAISTGNKFLGMKTKKMPVLYGDGENAPLTIKDRLEKIHKGMNLKRNKFPYFTLTEGLLMDEKKNINIGFEAFLEQQIEEKGIKVLIFDTMHRFAYYDENSSDDLNKLYTKFFKPLAHKYGVAIVFLHHSTKAGGYRGSGDFLGMVDVSYQIRRIPKTNKFQIINEKSRNGEIQDILGEIVFDENYIKINRLNAEIEQEKGISKLKEVTIVVKEYFQKFNINESKRRKEIFDFFELSGVNFPESTIKRTLKFLVDGGFLETDEKGKYWRVN